MTSTGCKLAIFTAIFNTGIYFNENVRGRIQQTFALLQKLTHCQRSLQHTKRDLHHWLF